MSKLTAERARERITHLKRWQEQRGLTLREEEYLEALELALGVLQPQDGGWVHWLGGECPVDPSCRVDVKFSVAHDVTGTAGNFFWLHDGGPADIVAYRMPSETLKTVMTTPPEFGHHNLPRDQETKRYAKD